MQPSKTAITFSCLLLLLFISGCGGPLACDLDSYEKLSPAVRYKVISENDSGFELGVHIRKKDFYTEKRHLLAEAKNQFRKVAKMVCAQRSREVGVIDENAFIESVDVGSKVALVRNWVFFKK